MTNKITKPKHYQFEKACHDVRDVIRDRVKRALENGYDPEIVYDYSNAIKYLLRWPDKNGIEDVRKSKYCTDTLLDLLISHEAAANQSVQRESDLPASLNDPKVNNVTPTASWPHPPMVRAGTNTSPTNKN